MIRSARLSPDGAYRYSLTRRAETLLQGPPMAWVMLNPSTADADVDDHTIRCCIRFALTAGYEAIEVLNLFALRATDPAELLDHPDPVGPENDLTIAAALAFRSLNESPVVCAWGNTFPKLTAPRTRFVRDTADRLGVSLWCLGYTIDGHPRHPARLNAATRLQRYEVPTS